MDDKHLRIIANPYLLKKNKSEKKINQTDKYLEYFLKDTYPTIYLNTLILSNIKNKIDEIITEHIVKKLVDEIITNCINKFD